MADINFLQLFIVFAILLFSLTVHEAAHAWTADRLGDSTARMLGRVSMNPAVHIDPLGTIVLPLIALLTNLPVLGWAKPVPVNILNLRGHWRQKYTLIAAAGPASNLVLAVVFAILIRLLPDRIDGLESSGLLIPSVLAQTISINVLLAVFNMVPVPPLDGGNVLSGLLPGRASEAFDRMRPYGFLIIYGLMFTGILGAILIPPYDFIRSLLL